MPGQFAFWRCHAFTESLRWTPPSLPGGATRQRQVSFCEFTNQWNPYRDRGNPQYSLFIVRGGLTRDGLLRVAIQDNLTPESGGFLVHDTARHEWIALVRAELAGYDTSREAFLGPYRGNPLVVEQGQCTGSDAYGDNARGSPHAGLTLRPGESRELLVMLGIGDGRSVGKQTVEEFGSLDRASEELRKLKANWLE